MTGSGRGRGGAPAAGPVPVATLVAAVSLLAACTPPPISLLRPPAPLRGPVRVVDAAVAAVGLDTIALSEVRLGCDLNRVREARVPVDPAALPPCPPEGERETIEQLVNQTLILEDAARFNIDMPAGDVARRLTQLEAKLVGPDGLARFLARHEIDRASLEARITREVLLGRYLERRIGLLVVVSPAEVEQYYREHQAEFGGSPLEPVEPEIRLYLQRLKYRDALNEYVSSLRARADLRRLLPVAERPAGGS